MVASASDIPVQAGTPPKLVLPILILVGVGVFSVLFFFQTRDPMILIFGVIAGGILWLVTFLSGGGRFAGAVQEVRIRCRSCGGLNPENARFCNACGKTL